MTRKVRVALFDKDLKVEIKKYPLTSDGTRIEIKQGGKAHSKPIIGNTHYLDMPAKKKYLLFGERLYNRTYFVMKWAKECVDFNTGKVLGQDIDEIMRAAGNKVLETKGKQKQETTTMQWVTLIALVLIFLKVFGILA